MLRFVKDLHICEGYVRWVRFVFNKKLIRKSRRVWKSYLSNKFLGVINTCIENLTKLREYKCQN